VLNRTRIQSTSRVTGTADHIGVEGIGERTTPVGTQDEELLMMRTTEMKMIGKVVEATSRRGTSIGRMTVIATAEAGGTTAAATTGVAIEIRKDKGTETMRTTILAEI
jgi:hypothetical protein